MAAAVWAANFAVSKPTTRRASVSMITRWGESRNFSKLRDAVFVGSRSVPARAL